MNTNILKSTRKFGVTSFFLLGVSLAAMSATQESVASPMSLYNYNTAPLGTLKPAPQSHEISLISSTVSATTASESMIQSLGDDVIKYLSNNTQSEASRSSFFRELLLKNFDMKTIGRFALGRYWRQASLEQRNEYLNLFEYMGVNVYSERFSEYSGQELRITGSRADGKKDTIVRSIVVSPSGGSDIRVDWRVRTKKNGSQRVIDVIVEGVSMSVTQRSDFSSVIQRGGGEIDVLLAHLRK